MNLTNWVLYISVIATTHHLWNTCPPPSQTAALAEEVSNGFTRWSTAHANSGVHATEFIYRKYFWVELRAWEGAVRLAVALAPAAPHGYLDWTEAPLPPRRAGGPCVLDQQRHVALHPSLRRPPRQPWARRRLPWQQRHPTLRIWPHGNPLLIRKFPIPNRILFSSRALILGSCWIWNNGCLMIFFLGVCSLAWEAQWRRYVGKHMGLTGMRCWEYISKEQRWCSQQLGSLSQWSTSLQSPSCSYWGNHPRWHRRRQSSSTVSSHKSSHTQWTSQSKNSFKHKASWPQVPSYQQPHLLFTFCWVGWLCINWEWGW